MPAIYNSAIRQKEKTEDILRGLIKNYPGIDVITSRVKSTPVKRENRNILDIYYRKDAIRINISMDSIQYTKYLSLLQEGIAYQKDSANPNSTHGVFAFFVNENDVERALKELLSAEAV